MINLEDTTRILRAIKFTELSRSEDRRMRKSMMKLNESKRPINFTLFDSGLDHCKIEIEVEKRTMIVEIMCHRSTIYLGMNEDNYYPVNLRWKDELSEEEKERLDKIKEAGSEDRKRLCRL